MLNNSCLYLSTTKKVSGVPQLTTLSRPLTLTWSSSEAATRVVEPLVLIRLPHYCEIALERE